MAEAKKATEEKPYNPMQDMVSVFLPRASGKEENFVFVGLNGKGYKVMRGAQVRVPRPVYDILMESERNKTRRDDYIDAQTQRAQA